MENGDEENKNTIQLPQTNTVSFAIPRRTKTNQKHQHVLNINREKYKSKVTERNESKIMSLGNLVWRETLGIDSFRVWIDG